MHKQQNKLIDREPHNEGEPCRDKNVPQVAAVMLSPPLNNDSSHQNGNADRGNPDHDEVDRRASSGEAIDRLGDCNIKLIHRFHWAAFGGVECWADGELNNNQAERRLNGKGLVECCQADECQSGIDDNRGRNGALEARVRLLEDKPNRCRNAAFIRSSRRAFSLRERTRLSKLRVVSR